MYLSLKLIIDILDFFVPSFHIILQLQHSLVWTGNTLGSQWLHVASSYHIRLYRFIV